jgi:purine-cytosine permease-like protein
MPYEPFRRFERVLWFPVVLVFIIATGIGGKHFSDAPAALPATASQIFTFGSTIAGFTMTWALISSDYTTYFHPGVSRFAASNDGSL